MKIIYSSRFRPVLITVLILSTAVFNFTSCTTLIFENNPEVMTALQEVFPQGGYYIYDEDSQVYTIYDSSKSEIGYAFYAEGKSYDGEWDIEGGKVGAPMKILVGLEDKETIKGISIVTHREDVIFWELLIKEDYFNQFTGLKIEDAHFTGDGGKLDCVTRATLSSRSVMDIVRETAIGKIKLIK
jgi:Na+-translocating ferredoxin:NAD+ oxidoreductase RnfG subunit